MKRDGEYYYYYCEVYAELEGNFRLKIIKL